MVLNYIWIGFFLVGFIVALFRVFGYYFRDFFMDHLGILFSVADREVFTAIVQSTFDMARQSIEISIYLLGVMTLWLGIMRIGERGGAVNVLSRLMNPFKHTPSSSCEFIPIAEDRVNRKSHKSVIKVIAS